MSVTALDNCVRRGPLRNARSGRRHGVRTGVGFAAPLPPIVARTRRVPLRGKATAGLRVPFPEALLIPHLDGTDGRSGHVSRKVPPRLPPREFNGSSAILHASLHANLEICVILGNVAICKSLSPCIFSFSDHPHTVALAGPKPHILSATSILFLLD